MLKNAQEETKTEVIFVRKNALFRDLREFVIINLGSLGVATAVFFFMMPSQVAVGSISALSMVLAYFSVSNDKISVPDSDKTTWRKIKALFPHSKHRSDYPAVKIGRLAVTASIVTTALVQTSLILSRISSSLETEQDAHS